jgi:hypothetical protein
LRLLHLLLFLHLLHLLHLLLLLLLHLQRKVWSGIGRRSSKPQKPCCS